MSDKKSNLDGSTQDNVRPHSRAKNVAAVLPEDVNWKSFAAFPPLSSQRPLLVIPRSQGPTRSGSERPTA